MKIRLVFLPTTKIPFKTPLMSRGFLYHLVLGCPDPLKVEWLSFMKTMRFSEKVYGLRIKLPLSTAKRITRLFTSNLIQKVLARVGISVEIFLPHLEIPSSDNVEVFTVMQMFLPKLFTVSVRGWGRSQIHPYGGLVATQLRPHDYAIGCAKNQLTKIPVTNSDNLLDYVSIKRKFGKRIALVVLQIPNDETILFRSTVSWKDFVQNVFELASRESGAAFVVRVHPRHAINASETVILEKLLALGNVFRSKGGIEDDFRNANLVILINSGVGFEALIRGIPVSSCGESNYSSFSSGFSSVERFEEMLTKANQGLERFEKVQEGFINSNFETMD